MMKMNQRRVIYKDEGYVAGFAMSILTASRITCLQLADASSASEWELSGGLFMLRLALYTAGVSAGLAAWIAFARRNAGRVPARRAADLLREAWADNHTQA